MKTPFSDLLASLKINFQPSIPHLLLFLLILTYTVYFSWYTINRHNSLNSYAADLSLIDQPLWNTVRGPGGFMEQTWGDRQQPRLAEHFEPVLIPLALLSFLWNDVRILLIAQSLALALGALPVFWIARRQLTFSLSQTNHPPMTTPKSTPAPAETKSLHLNPKSKIQNPSVPGTGAKSTWSALAFAAAYLLFPQLQAANVADFHADPFVVTPLLFAFWYAVQQRWLWMWLWAIVAMLTKENLPTLTAMLGLYLIFDAYRANPAAGRPLLSISSPLSTPVSNIRTQIKNAQTKHGLGLLLVSVTWFLIATFLIVAPLARRYFGTEGPIYLANRFSGGLAALPELLQEPARWQYLAGLLAAVGFLPLLAPELLILGLPVLAANFLSNFSGQYSGEQHYSAPLAAAFIVAAIYGAGRLVRRSSLYESKLPSLKQLALIGVCLWLMGWALGYHALHGWTPLSIRTETYRPGPRALILPDFLSQIPPDAIVSSSPAVHPHLAHRRVNYLFPIVEDAGYLLVDITDISGVHPNDVRSKILEMLNANWRLLKAGHGLLLAQKSEQPVSNPSELPAEFFDFARAAASPTHPTRLAFSRESSSENGGPLRLVGYDLHDDPDDGVIFRFYWQAVEPLPEDLYLWPLIYDDFGRLLNDPTQAPMIAAVWYPPAAWLPEEIVVTETLPQLLPGSFHLGIAAGPENSFYDPSQRFSVSSSSSEGIRLYPGRWAQLATFRREGPLLAHLTPRPTLQPLTPVQAQFGSSIQLTGFWLDETQTRPGATLPLILRWFAIQPPPTDLTVFVHLLAPDGSLAAQSDAIPTWLTPQPTSQWPPRQPVTDYHDLILPPDLPPATYTLQLGLYDVQTLERLTLHDGSNAFRLLEIRVE